MWLAETLITGLEELLVEAFVGVVDIGIFSYVDSEVEIFDDG